jgi:hypothetical protein
MIALRAYQIEALDVTSIIASRAKTALCAAIAALPCQSWPRASALVRWLWKGFRDA